jgi:hypothetical protein
MEYYLTDDILLKDNKLFHAHKEIKKHNWHNLLKYYGWEKLHKNWIRNLNSYLKKPSNNSQFGCLDCGGDGDCLFFCISYALKSKELYNINYECDVKYLRKLITESITGEKFEEIITIYRILNESNDFDEEWDPDTITIQEFKEKIIEGGNEYWGDHILLNILKEVLNINLIILNSNEITNEYYHYPLMFDYHTDMKTIILLYENKIHFKLIGYFQNGNMISYFEHKDIPEEILKIINYIR